MEAKAENLHWLQDMSFILKIFSQFHLSTFIEMEPYMHACGCWSNMYRQREN
jgi:hypothetical protein